MSRHAGALAALLVALLMAAAPVQAIDPAARGEAFNRIEKKTMCIECNVPLNIAEAAQADATRAQIRLLLDRGLDDQQVLDQLVEDFGPNVLATPKAEGFNVLAFVVPVAALGALLAVGLVLLPRWRRNRRDGGDEDRTGAPDDGSGPTRAEHERLDAELARYGA
ncbi:MAG: cytochrome c-type biogenesis protein CcmH [Solirubrobacterales bacterium]|nr:cytochrome c-type biogenesis protein CcmH [Solirubrobacterales bacterium]